MNKFPIEPGRAALSRMGRDAGRRFVVLRMDALFAFIVDGDLRKVEAPKKKKLRHLRSQPEFFPSVVEMLKDGKLPSNAEVRKLLAEAMPG